MVTLKEKKVTSYTKEERIYYVDVLRIIACLSVLYLHTRNEGSLDEYTVMLNNIPAFLIYSLGAIICRNAVPLFFAISGALILSKSEESLREMFQKRIFRIAIALIIASMFYYFRMVGYDVNEISIFDLLQMMWTNQVIGPLWYLYAYIAFLLSSPFLRILAQNMDSKRAYYFCGMIILFAGVIPFIEMAIVGTSSPLLNKNLSIITIGGGADSFWFLIFPLVGYIIENNLLFKIENKKHTIVLALFNIVAIMITQMLLYVFCLRSNDQVNVNCLDRICSYFNVIYVCFIFAIGKLVNGAISKKKRIAKLFQRLGKDTFGVYLIHVCVKNTTTLQLFLRAMYDTGISHLFATWSWVIVIFLISVIITELLKMIPFFGKIL